EVVFDNLYLDIKNFLDMPLDLRVGRQDLLFTYGEGFLIMDGTPLDGSRTFYFNSAKATWRIDNINSVDLVYIKSEREDDTLPIINEKTPHQQLNTSDEEAGVLYWKRAPVDNFSLEGYYIFKIENDGGARLQAQKTELNTIGSFAKYTFEPWTLKGQLAYQFGDYGPEDREGLGGYVFVDRTFKDVAWSPEVSGGFIYLSGDEASTSKNEAWDPLFSRWPWMSELYSLSFNGESGLDYWTNLQMWRSSLVLRPTDKTKFSLWYNFLMANETPAGTSFSVDSGKQRGHLPQMRLDYSFNKNINAYILAEYFIPGNFYSDEADSSLFLRTELSFEF
ncbi:MAG: alginate export family protein, partial [Candidatus Omnitrophica bacterium]|nr:alginate export family protein [Candidatus Omnitrophota bacterium]